MQLSWLCFMSVSKPFDAQAAISVKAVAHTPSHQELHIQSTSFCPEIYIIIHRASELYLGGQWRDYLHHSRTLWLHPINLSILSPQNHHIFSRKNIPIVLRCYESSVENITLSIHKMNSFFKKIYSFYVHEYFLCTLGVQKRLFDPLVLRLGMAVCQFCCLWTKMKALSTIYTCGNSTFKHTKNLEWYINDYPNTLNI